MMTNKAAFTARFGSVLKRLAADWNAKVSFGAIRKGSLLVYIDWTSQHQLAATLRILVDNNNLDVHSFLNGRFVPSEICRPLDTLPEKLRADLQQVKADIESLRQPPEEAT